MGGPIAEKGCRRCEAGLEGLRAVCLIQKPAALRRKLRRSSPIEARNRQKVDRPGAKKGEHAPHCWPEAWQGGPEKWTSGLEGPPLQQAAFCFGFKFSWETKDNGHHLGLHRIYKGRDQNTRVSRS